MDNDFSGDASCKVLWNVDNGALTTDSKGDNTLIDVNTVQTDLVNFKQGDASSLHNAGVKEFFYIADADLDAGVPLKSDDSTKIITVCLWFRLATVDADQTFVGKYDYSNNKRTLLIGISDTGSGEIAIYHGWNGGVSAELLESSGINPSVSTFYHLGYTYDDSDKSYYIKVQEADGSVLWETSGNWTNNINIEDAKWVLGAMEGSSYLFPLNGNLDEVALFNEIKSEADIDKIRAGTYGAVGGVSLTIQDPVHNHIADFVSAQRIRPLTIMDSVHSQISDTVSETRTRNVNPTDSIHGQITDKVSQSLLRTLSIQDPIHTQVADIKLTLSAAITITVMSAIHSQLADSVVPTRTRRMSVTDAIHAGITDILTTQRIRQLTLQDPIHSMVSDYVLTPRIISLAVQEPVHDHFTDRVATSTLGEDEYPVVMFIAKDVPYYVAAQNQAYHHMAEENSFLYVAKEAA